MILVPLSTVDEIGKLSATIFIRGCNFDCVYCQNHDLIGALEDIKGKAGKIREVVDERSIAECFVVSGGEPTLHADLKEFLSDLKSTGKKIYLNTNGFFPERLKEVSDLLDGVSMDVKTSFRKYPEVVNVKGVDCRRVAESVDFLIRKQCKDFKVEFRTTMAEPLSTRDDVVEIASYLKERGFSGYYALQQLDVSAIRERNAKVVRKVPTSEMLSIAESLIGFPFKVFVRTLDRGIVKFF